MIQSNYRLDLDACGPCSCVLCSGTYLINNRQGNEPKNNFTIFSQKLILIGLIYKANDMCSLDFNLLNTCHLPYILDQLGLTSVIKS